MVTTNDCMPMRSYLSDFIEKYPEYNYMNFEIVSLYEFAKFGKQLSNFYLIRNKLTNLLQLWYSDADFSLLSNKHNLVNNTHTSFDQVISMVIDNYHTKQIIPFEFENVNFLLDYTIRLDHPYGLLIENDNKIGLFLINNYAHLIKWYDQIKHIGYDFLLATENDESFFLNPFGEIVTYLGKCIFGSLINEKLFISVCNGAQSIRNLNNEIVAPVVLYDFVKLTDNQHYLTKCGNKFSIYDFYGNKMSEDFDIIKNMNDRYIVAQNNDEFYLLGLTGNIITHSSDFMVITRVFWSFDH